MRRGQAARDPIQWQATTPPKPADSSSGAAPAPRRCAIAASRPTAGGLRRRLDAVLAAAILAVETLLLATLWGPQPAGWLWIGSQIFHETDSVGFGLLVAFVGMLATILAHDRDRDAARPRLEARPPGKRPRAEEGRARADFVISMVIAGIAFFIWFLVIHGPGRLSSTSG